MKSPNKTWEDFDRERTERLIEKIGPNLYQCLDYLVENPEEKPEDLLKRCPSCGVYQGQYHMIEVVIR